jgi:hypothetical protein
MWVYVVFCRGMWALRRLSGGLLARILQNPPSEFFKCCDMLPFVAVVGGGVSSNHSDVRFCKVREISGDRIPHGRVKPKKIHGQSASSIKVIFPTIICAVDPQTSRRGLDINAHLHRINSQSTPH